MKNQPAASIIILTYNNLEMTRQCIDSIYARTSVPFELILVDNASADETPAYLARLKSEKPNVHLILNKENLGFAKGNNQGAEAAQGEYLVFLNNDTIVTRGWLKGLIRHLQEPKVGMVGPVTNQSGNEARIAVSYENIPGMEAFAQHYTEQHQGKSFEINMLAFFCVVMRRSVWQDVGPLDERFGIGMFEDDDYALRVKKKGYKILCAEDVFVHHWGSASFSQLQLIDYWSKFTENRKKFENKWGIRWQPHHYRSELIQHQINQQMESSLWYLSLFAKERAKTETLQRRLDEIQSSKSWKFAQLFSKPYLRVPVEGSTDVDSQERGKKPANSETVPLKERIRDKINRHRMSWFAFSFDHYKRARHNRYPVDLYSIHCPSQPGLISIILPVYNGERYIADAIESALAQTYENFELIIVDDGSTDETLSIVKKYASQDERIKIIHQTNQKLPRALSNGFHHARGQYLTWTSADNRLKPKFLETMRDCLVRHPNWEMIYANIDIIDEHGNPLVQSNWYKGYQVPPGSEHIMLPVDPSELNTYPNNYVSGAFMYRDRVDYLIGDYSTWRFGIEDYDYWMKVNALLSLHHLDSNEILYDYRFHPDSLTSQDKDLGITRDRIRTMIFDNFRRDFYLTPLIWKIDGAENTSLLAEQIDHWISSKGHLHLDTITSYEQVLPRLWMPIVCMKLVQEPSGEIQPPEDWSANVFKVLVVTPASEKTLPEEVSNAWDMTIVTNYQEPLPRLATPHQGWLAIPSVDVLCTAIDIKARLSHLADIEKEAEDPSPPEVKISVVVCTYHRGEKLITTLKSIVDQSFSPDDYELIVVNNDPEDQSVDEIIDGLKQTDFKGRQEHLKLIPCPLKGLSFARNVGISEARGEVISFIDDDAIATPDWLTSIWTAFNIDPNAGVVGGNIRLMIPEPRPRWLKPGWEKFWSQFLPGYDKLTAVDAWWQFPWGANWSARRQALLAIGGFRSQYGRKGRDFGGAEEVIAASLIHQLGYNVLIYPQAEVLHNPDPSRYTLKHVWHSLIASKRNYYYIQLDLYIPKEISPRSIVKNFLHYLNLAFLSRNLRWYQRIEYLTNAGLEFVQFGRWLRDGIARFHKSYAIQS